MQHKDFELDYTLSMARKTYNDGLLCLNAARANGIDSIDARVANRHFEDTVKFLTRDISNLSKLDENDKIILLDSFHQIVLLNFYPYNKLLKILYDSDVLNIFSVDDQSDKLLVYLGILYLDLGKIFLDKNQKMQAMQMLEKSHNMFLRIPIAKSKKSAFELDEANRCVSNHLTNFGSLLYIEGEYSFAQKVLSSARPYLGSIKLLCKKDVENAEFIDKTLSEINAVMLKFDAMINRTRSASPLRSFSLLQGAAAPVVGEAALDDQVNCRP